MILIINQIKYVDYCYMTVNLRIDKDIVFNF